MGDVKQLLGLLPSDSKASLADNPDIVDLFEDGRTLELTEWPYLMLLEDQKTGSYTWHLLCNEHNIPRLIRQGMKSAIDDYVSIERNRNLRGVELICRNGYRHLFI